MKVTDFRLTSIWIEGRPDTLGPADLGRFGACVRGKNYADLFKQLLEYDNDPLVTLPWPRRRGKRYPERNHFWADYLISKLQQGRPSDAGDICCAALAPLRRKISPVRIIRQGRRSFVEGWYYPHGVALTATLWCRGAFEPSALHHAANNFLAQPLQVTWPDGRGQTLRLTGLAGACLETLRVEAFGVRNNPMFLESMSVLSIISTEAEASDTAQVEQDLLAAALDCIGGRPDATSQPALGSDIHTPSKGRVVWRPDKARAASGETHTLGCLHRNLVLSTLQTASLIAGLDAALAALQQASNALQPRVEAYFRRLAKQLEQIHTGTDTYNLDCLRRQTEAAKDRMNRLRGILGWRALP
jgi:hypothetical protein